MSNGPSTLQLRLDTLGYRLGLTMPWSERASHRRPWSVTMGAKINEPRSRPSLSLSAASSLYNFVLWHVMFEERIPGVVTLLLVIIFYFLMSLNYLTSSSLVSKWALHGLFWPRCWQSSLRLVEFVGKFSTMMARWVGLEDRE